MDASEISVIIPTYNRAGMAAEAVESALAQSRPVGEIIVVDDGSTDDTREAMARYSGQIRYVPQKNQGVSAARNTGIAAARGEWIAFLDSDEVWHARKTEVQCDYLRNHPEIDLLGAELTVFKSAGQCSSALPEQETKGIRIPLEKLVIRAHFQTSTVVVRKKCVEAVGMFDTTLRSAEDRNLWIRVGSKYAVEKLQIPLVFTRPEDRDHLSGKPGATETNCCRMLDKVFEELPELHGMRLLKRKALSVTAHEAGLSYTEMGEHAKAVQRILRSIYLWPLSNGTKSSKRMKNLMVIGMRMAKLRKE